MRRKRRTQKSRRGIGGRRKSDIKPTTENKKGSLSKARLERGLRILRETNDIKVASRAIRVSPEKFRRAAKRKHAIRKTKTGWKLTRRVSRRMPVFTSGQQLAITVRSRSASLIGRYMAAVRKFVRTNNPAVLSEFVGRSIKDVRGKPFAFEIRPNALHRLSSAGSEPFEDIYRIVL